jgi:hypothetical protein
MLVSRLTNAIGDELNDIEPGYEHTRWPLPQLFEYITEALEQIAALKPELFASTEVVRLKPGAAQTVPSSLSKLLDVTTNVNSDGSSGDPILPANYTLSRYFNKPSCISSIGKVSSFRVDPNNPRVFYVNPPAEAHPPQFIQLLGQTRPQAIRSTADDIEFSGGDASTYFNAIKDWALYRAFMKDTESQTSMQRAQQHYRGFYQFLNVKVQMDMYNKGQRKQAAQQVKQDDADV